MLLAGGDVIQYEAIRQGTIGNYLIKLNNYVEEIEMEIKYNKQKQKKASGGGK